MTKSQASRRNRVTLTMAIVAIVVSAGASGARAGFLDERIAPPVPAKPAAKPKVAPPAPAASAGSAPAPAAVPAMVPAPEDKTPSGAVAALNEAGATRGVVRGTFSNPGWNQPAPRLASPVSVPSAFSRLLPEKHPPVTIESDDTGVDEEVSWPDTGMSRKEALEHVAAKYGLNMILGDGILRIAKAKVQPGPAVYSVSPTDQNFRKLLKRWASQAGFTFTDEHWTLTRDVPIIASGSLGTDFKTAVRIALDSTELTSMPARPCFYSNGVLRVVPRAELCNRTK